jgi:hypothetical protein
MAGRNVARFIGGIRIKETSGTECFGGVPKRTREQKCFQRRFDAAAIARRSQRRLSRIAKGLRTRCYSSRALARIAKGDGCRRQYFEMRWMTLTTWF